MAKPQTGSIHGVPYPTLWRLMTLADKRGIRVVDLLAELAVTGRPTEVTRIAPTTQQRIAMLRAKGLTPQQIIAETGMAPSGIYRHLRIIAETEQ